MNKSGSEILVYEAADGEVRVDVRLEHGTVWLNQQQMAELFGRERSVITRHVRSVFREGELDEKSNVHFLHIAGSDRPVGFYNLDVIISVGYRVKSRRGTQFRIWATRTLREHLVQGYTLNRPRLARGAGLRRAGAGRSAVRNLGGGVRLHLNHGVGHAGETAPAAPLLRVVSSHSACTSCSATLVSHHAY